MKMSGMKISLLLAVMIFIVGCSDHLDPKKQEQNKSKNGGTSVEGLAGVWRGTINVPNQPLPIMVTFEDKGGWNGTISIPVQGVKDYPLSKVRTDQSAISFHIEMAGQTITFNGEKGGGTIAGTFTQAGQSFPFELNKGEAEKNGTEQEEGQFLSVDTNEGKLYGELETPKEKGPHPVVIIIPGSGPTDRDGNSVTLQGKNNSLKLLAEELAEQGIASVRYDKRGVGKNQSAAIPEKELRFDQFVKDAAAWVEMLNKDEQFSKVGVIGHSQGSLVGMAAAAETDVDAFVSIAGAGRPIDEVLYDQLKVNLTEELKQESKEILEKLKQGEQVESVSKELQSMFRSSVQPFLASWIQYNPVKEIQKLEIPVLIINGKHDLQVPVSEAENLYEAKVEAELLLIDRMNHVLKEAPKDRAENLQSYSNPDLPLSDGLVKGIVSFLKDAEFIE
ncbi:alpha/beta hydrolase [Halobacillus shinanisalinarum]|uniref:Alpha/beta hydrolase n=1 Tax=Halobacillus shinanisalinarum TaxID=2932258 RepID=A0ABY4H2H7_9BACI|nr:alpha/beta fold hydrolase [Halobacillus shinanisalinarum]UOQ94660.1 alpha/beta hydrolase [Halobacillus shinanisalinarum]